MCGIAMRFPHAKSLMSASSRVSFPASRAIRSRKTSMVNFNVVHHEKDR